MRDISNDPFESTRTKLEDLRRRRLALTDINKEDLVDWIDTLAIKVDGKNFDWDSHKYLTKPYNDKSRVVVVQKAAQMGFSIWAMLKVLHRTIKLSPIKVGYFLPTGPKAAEFSQDRFDPMVKAIPKLNSIYSSGNVRNNMFKQYGGSSVFFTHTGGKASTESTPMDYLVFDEVRKMSRQIIATARERVSHSKHKFIDFISTAGFPDDDINYYFKRSNQNEWLVKCPKCNHEFLPHDDWEDLKYVEWQKAKGEEEGRWGLRCAKCGAWGFDAQDNGDWKEMSPGKDWAGYHITQLISRWITLDEIMEEWFSADNRSEFYQSKLGLPYVDEDTILVQPDHLESCIDPEMRWGQDRPRGDSGVRVGFDDVVTVLGCDQQQGYNVTVVKEVYKSGKTSLVHLEYSYEKPFDRLAQLYREYDIDIGVIDAEPNFNEAEDFCRQFKGRSWMAYYSSSGGAEYAIWHDMVKKGSEQSGKTARRPHHVTIDRVSGMEFSLLKWKNRRNMVPDPLALTQDMKARDTFDPSQDQLMRGSMIKTAVCRDIFFTHLQRVAKERIAKEMKSGAEIVGQADFKFIHVGIDPHFAHANLYADIAALRGSRLNKAGAGPSDVWYSDSPGEDLSVAAKVEIEEKKEKEKFLVEVAPGVRVSSVDLAAVDNGKVRCPQCVERNRSSVYRFEDTREAYYQEKVSRLCMNCLMPEKEDDEGNVIMYVTPFPDPPRKQSYRRRNKLRPD